ncbi:MAG TPA: hypothetical protein VG326_00135 [Tepidisphaeraceae bacterium]|jgi:hypothetical protein|nr:hypothetical protein [Tepidisphaeraceae bacterium]
MKRAFTLIEQLAALALATLFMLAAFGVLAALARNFPQNRQAFAQDASFARAAELIRRDLTDARRVRVGDDQFTLCGFNSLEANTLAVDHRPVRVVYRIERNEHSSRLMRRQEALDVLSNRNAWSELVCENIAHIALVPQGPVPNSGGPPIADVFGPGDGRELPGVFVLKLIGADPGQPGFDCTIPLR